MYFALVFTYHQCKIGTSVLSQTQLTNRYQYQFSGNLEFLYILRPELPALEIESLMLFALQRFIVPGSRECLVVFSNNCDPESSEDLMKNSVYLVPLYLLLLILFCQPKQQAMSFIMSLFSSEQSLNKWIEVLIII